MAINWLDVSERKAVIDEINSDENLSRKRAEQRKFDVYRNRQDRYVIEKLEKEMKKDFVDRMRKVLSVNPCLRIVNEMASLYRHEPERHFSGASENEQAQIDALYKQANFNAQMRLLNIFYKLHDQAALMVMPMRGAIEVRPLTPKDYDVIPDDDYPELAAAYILSVWDLDRHKSYRENEDGQNRYNSNDQRNQRIADDSDRLAKKNYIVWTKDVHFTMTSKGEIVGEIVPNPIGELPFIDVATEKDFQFFVRRGSGVVDFTIDLLAQLSDAASISRIQGYSQAIISHHEEPKNLILGPDRVIWLRKDPNNPTSDPSFEFASPSPDLAGTLALIDAQVKMFLSSMGLDTTVISGKGEQRTFTSGVDHLLANLDKFQASQQDMALFRMVEEKAFNLMRAWSNELQGVTEGKLALNEALRSGVISENVNVTIKFHSPTSVRTQTETEDSVIKLMESGLMSRKQAIMRLHECDEQRAEEILAEIDAETSGENQTDEAAEGF